MILIIQSTDQILMIMTMMMKMEMMMKVRRTRMMMMKTFPGVAMTMILVEKVIRDRIVVSAT